MAIATYMGDDRLSNKDFEAIFQTEWEARLDEVMPLVRELNLNKTDRYRYGESVMGVVVAPKSNENGQTKYFAPHPGKDVFITTDIYKFGMRATQEYREYGKGDYAQFPAHMVEVMDYTVKTKVFNQYNVAFDVGSPNKYDGKPLCATDHPLAGGGAASNTLATPADLNEQSFEAASELMLRTPTEDGVITQRYVPRRLITSIAKWGDNLRHTSSTFTTHTQNERGPNVPNVSRNAFGMESFFHPMLISADDWFVQSAMSPIAIVWSRRPTLYGGDLDKEQNIDWICKMQLAVVADTWRGLVGVQGTT